jgi:hypothetical protein
LAKRAASFFGAAPPLPIGGTVVRARLHDDPIGAGVVPALPTVQRLDEDAPPTIVAHVNPTLTVRKRTKTGYNDSGNAVFEWADVVTGEAMVYESRMEFDDTAGVSVVMAKAVLIYDGDDIVTESARVESDDGSSYRVTRVDQVPGVLTLEMTRIDSG